MTVVIDASAAVLLILRPPSTAAIHELAAAESLHAPSHFDIECISAMRRSVHLRTVDRASMESLSVAVLDLPVTRHPIRALVPRMVELLDNASMYDAAYIALAEGLEADLLTADARLAGVPGVHCRVRLL